MSLLEGLARYVGTGGTAVTGFTYSTATGGNVFVEALPQAPDIAVALYSTGGFEADTLLPYDSPHVQFIIRGDEDPRTALILWDRLYSALHSLEHVDLPGGPHLVAAIAMQSGPVRLGTDTDGRYRFSLNLRCEVIHSTSHRPADEDLSS